VRDAGVERQQAARREVVAARRGADAQRAAQDVDRHEAERAVLRHAAAGVEGEEHEAHGAMVGDRDLPVSGDRRVRLAPERGERRGEVEVVLLTGEALGGRLAKTVLGGGHAVRPPANGSGSTGDWRLPARCPAAPHRARAVAA
jgi:hypothetical protein